MGLRQCESGLTPVTKKRQFCIPKIVVTSSLDNLLQETPAKEEHFAMRINFVDKSPLYVLRMSRTHHKRGSVTVEVSLFIEKVLEIKDVDFLRWVLVNDLDAFFEMQPRTVLGRRVQIEYGYYQGNREVLGCYKYLDDDDFTEHMMFTITEYAKYMLK